MLPVTFSATLAIALHVSLARLIALSGCLLAFSFGIFSSKEDDMNHLAIENGRRDVQGQTKG